MRKQKRPLLITLLTPDFKPTYVATKILLFPYVVVGIALLANQVSPKDTSQTCSALTLFPDLHHRRSVLSSCSHSEKEDERALCVQVFRF